MLKPRYAPDQALFWSECGWHCAGRGMRARAAKRLELLGRTRAIAMTQGRPSFCLTPENIRARGLPDAMPQVTGGFFATLPK